MSIILDFREHALMCSVEKMKDKYPDITIEQQNLNLGDILIPGNNILIERKTWSDLEASIKDGRYLEQSHRLKEATEEGYHVYYFLEGDLARHRGALPITTLISTIYSLTDKGFFVIQPRTVDETALFIFQFATKILKDSKNTSKSTSYESASLNKKKNSHITRENISLYMLAQIPGVSIINATAILESFEGHISNLILSLNENQDILNGLSQTTKDGKKRKINKNVIENIKEFLMKKESETILAQDS